jgi:acetyl-CoA synthetase (ADP-forming)
VAAGLAPGLPAALVQEQVPPGLELIVSIRRDPQFGPFVLAGAGGVLVELLADIAIEPAPISHATARAMLDRLRIAALFGGYRGAPACDIAAAADVLVRLSWLAADLGARLVDLECNPLIVGPQGVRAVDLRGTIHAMSAVKEPKP